MTSLAFILGCMPLWLADGSGAVSRRVMGTAVVGGMFAASALAIFLIPVTFYVIEMWATKGLPHSAHASALHPVMPAHPKPTGDHPADAGKH
jgi:HAE1 family hydrophobic/amphiphilic exporter-1